MREMICPGPGKDSRLRVRTVCWDGQRLLTGFFRRGPPGVEPRGPMRDAPEFPPGGNKLRQSGRAGSDFAISFLVVGPHDPRNRRRERRKAVVQSRAELGRRLGRGARQPASALPSRGVGHKSRLPFGRPRDGWAEGAFLVGERTFCCVCCWLGDNHQLSRGGLASREFRAGGDVAPARMVAAMIAGTAPGRMPHSGRRRCAARR